MVTTLAGHDDVEQLWYFGPKDGVGAVELASAGNMKRTWCEGEPRRDWTANREAAGGEFLRQASHVKNIWVPYGE